MVIAAAPVTSLAQSASSTDTTSATVDRLFERWRSTETPGCAVGVGRRDSVLLERGYGMANLETATAITPATVFHAASLAKQVTAMATMLLVRDGKLSLDADIRTIIPELPDYGSPITVRHLLTHTSGLRDFIEVLTLARGRFEENRITQADMLDIVARQKSLNFRPGAEYLYNNTGYALLAVIVGRVAGKSLRDFAAERIFSPLGMSRTKFKDDFTAIIPGAAAGYDARGTGWRSSAPNYDVYGPTNLATTVGDMLKWATNYERNLVGDSSIVRQMTTSVVLPTGDSTNYGFGIALANDRGLRLEEHEGSDPGFRAYLGRYPESGLAVTVLCNTRSATAVSLGRRVAAAYLPGAPPAAPLPMPMPAPVDSLSIAQRAGFYFQPTRVEVVELSWRDGSLYTARRGGRKLIPVGGNRFQVEGLPVIHTFGAGPNTGYVATSLLPGRQPVTFEWRAPRARSTFKDFAGTYVSDELNSIYRVEARSDSTIGLKTGTSDGLVARPVFADTFVSGQIVIEFDRSAGKVSGFKITHPRARRLQFKRRTDECDNKSQCPSG